jgi:hypothetical protein
MKARDGLPIPSQNYTELVQTKSAFENRAHATLIPYFSVQSHISRSYTTL